MRSLLILLLLAVCPLAMAAPPYSVTVEFSAASGVVDGYRLYVNDALIGPVMDGVTLTDLLTSDGEYTLEVRPFNVTGEQTVGNATVMFDTNDLPPPLPGPVDSLTITIDCDTQSPPSCQVTSVTAP